MQDKDFDRFMQQSLDSFPEPEYDPAHWDKLEDRLHQFNASQPQPSAGSGLAGSSMAKLGLAASAILVTAVNVALFTKPELFKNATEPAAKTVVVAPQESYIVPAENEPAEIVPAPQETAPVIAMDPEETPAIASEGSMPETQGSAVTEIAAIKENAAITAPAAAARTASPVAVQKKDKNKPAVTAASSALQPGNTLAWPTGAAGKTTMTPGGMSAGKPVATADNCAGNTKPVVGLALAGNDTIRNGRIAMSTCQTLTARFFTYDKDSDKVTVTSNIASVLPGASLFSDKADQPGLMLHWEAKPEMARQQPYEFTLWLTDNRCPNAEPRAVKYALSITPAYTIAIKGNTEIQKGEATTLVVTGAPSGATYQWQAGGVPVSGNQSVKVQPAQTTTYYLQVNSPAGCQLIDSVKVQVAKVETGLAARKAEIPNIFTPNNDGVNDFFEISLPEEGPYRLEVFDRWGKRVYENAHYNNRWAAQGLVSGTYYYIVTTKTEKKAYKGWVEVIR